MCHVRRTGTCGRLSHSISCAPCLLVSALGSCQLTLSACLRVSVTVKTTATPAKRKPSNWGGFQFRGLSSRCDMVLGEELTVGRRKGSGILRVTQA